MRKGEGERRKEGLSDEDWGLRGQMLEVGFRNAEGGKGKVKDGIMDKGS